MRIELPFPPPELSPNARLHWRAKADAVRTYRDSACYMAMVAGAGCSAGSCMVGEIPLTVIFCPPDNRKRDRTNMEAAFKAGFDGIADALGVDDNRFVPTYRKGEVVKGGKVIVEIGG